MSTPGTPPQNPPVRDAAAVILVRRTARGPEVLMGQRGAQAAFMPDKFVFPGGALDPSDALVPFGAGLSAVCAARLEAADADSRARAQPSARALAAAAIRELWEETGLMLGTPGTWPGPVPGDWAGFAQRGLTPAADALSFMFRAITPPGRARRFDARFFLAEAACVHGDPADFSAAGSELRHLAWLTFDRARSLNLPFITEIVLAEAEAALRAPGPPASVPFFDVCADGSPAFRRIS